MNLRGGLILRKKPPEYVFFAGSANSVYRWSSYNSTWVNIGFPGRLMVTALDGTGPNDLWVGTDPVVSTGVGTIWHYDGSSWTSYSFTGVSTNRYIVYDIQAVSATEAYVIYTAGDHGAWVIAKWNGTGWSNAIGGGWWANAGVRVGSVWAAAADDIYGTAYVLGGNDMAHWNGAAVSTANVFPSGYWGAAVRGYSASEVIICGAYEAGSPTKLIFKKGAWGSWPTTFDSTADYAGGGGTTIQLTDETIWALVWKSGNARYLRMFDRITLAKTEEALGVSTTTYGLSVVDSNHIGVAGVSGAHLRLNGVWSTSDPAGGTLYSIKGFAPT